MIQVILFQQTPEVTPPADPYGWIRNNGTLLGDFLAYTKKRDDAVGLAANQIQIGTDRLMEDFFAIKQTELLEWSLVVSPVIHELRGEPETKHESCLTWPGKTIVAERWPEIRASWWTQEGRHFDNEVITGYNAQIWQHETDHLRGVEEKFFKSFRREAKIGRNDPCPCGSGKKHKKCCLT